MALLIFGSFKGMDAGRESYILPENIVKEIGRLTLTANKTVPSTFGRSIPNPAEERNFFTAEAWVTWTTLYAPVLLRNRFARPKYYKHFMLFVSIVTRVMRPKSSKAQRDTLRADIKKWYAQVEQIFYQKRASRLKVCVSQFHAWLHVVDYIEQAGPLTSFWCWVCERYCGLYARSISSRRHPYASLNRRAFELQALQAVINKYDLQADLPVYTHMHESRGLATFHTPEYPKILLLHPRKVLHFVTNNLNSLKWRVARNLARQFGRDAQYYAPFIPATIEQYGRLDLEGGDRVNSRVTTASTEARRRDATFIEYEILVDRLAHRPRAPPDLELRTWFGQVERIFVVQMPACPDVAELVQPRAFIFLDVHTCAASRDRQKIWSYVNFGAFEVVDAANYRSLVGRIPDRGGYAFIRRPAVLRLVAGEGADEDDEEED